MTSELPAHWARAMERANIGDPRLGRPSMRALAEKAGESPETVRRLIKGVGTPTPTTVASVAEALGLSPVTVSKWVGQSRSSRRGWEPPEEALLLTDAEGKALTALIRAMTAGRENGSAEILEVAPATPTRRKRS